MTVASMEKKEYIKWKYIWIQVYWVTCLWCNNIEKSAYPSSHSLLFSTSKDCLKIRRISCKAQNLLLNMLFMRTGKGATVTVIWTDFLVILYSTKWKLLQMNVLTDCLSCKARALWSKKDNKLFSYAKHKKVHDHFYYTAFSWFTALISSLRNLNFFILSLKLRKDTA